MQKDSVPWGVTRYVIELLHWLQDDMQGAHLKCSRNSLSLIPLV